MYYNAYFVQRDIETAIVFYKRAASDNITEALFELCDIYIELKDYENSSYYYEKINEPSERKIEISKKLNRLYKTERTNTDLIEALKCYIEKTDSIIQMNYEIRTSIDDIKTTLTLLQNQKELIDENENYIDDQKPNDIDISVWNCISDYSKRSINTYYYLDSKHTSPSKIDYSGLIVLLTNPLEKEVNRLFANSLIRHAEMIYGSETKEWPEAIKCIKEQGFLTLGNITYIFPNPKYKKKQNEMMRTFMNSFLKEYISSEYSKEYSDFASFFKSHLENLVKRCEEIRKIRNKAAHANDVNINDLQVCKTQILGDNNTESIFKDFLCIFNTYKLLKQ